MRMIQLQGHRIGMTKTAIECSKVAGCTQMYFAVVAIGISPDRASVTMAFSTIMLFSNDFPPPDFEYQWAVLPADKIIVIAGNDIVASRFTMSFSDRVRFLLMTP
ncbi:hypothetical protein EWN99_19630 [Salmonella enterica]|uniref:Uncharacterized protein n=2 Tax=Salmonella enterica subsp. salamae TaxID=59202 RepID=A0A5Y2LSV0_SALER|nr:hypothetical protein [Salmonella enterica]ECE6360382.1 hypothetical protein [Salmonella enterica subsp. salamae]HAC6543750.1 hypothetical protein [Salmonella enterica subsp. salamae serovar 48:d:z6]EAP9950621.1 hypothetical protein [Salmonella enterica]EAR6708907.1 hypothetical protein [Salmonella enterica]